MDAREIYRIAPDAAKVAAAAIQTRNAAERAVKAQIRSKRLDAAVQVVSASLARKGSNVTRRVMCEELTKQGLQVKWAESKHLLALMRHYTALAEAGLHGPQSAASGNS
ncbi:MAG TPA: hypothetical protein VN617_04235 [Rhodoferax sp.]|nr:hypothetical protein [Rhodoferax sp.]